MTRYPLMYTSSRLLDPPRPDNEILEATDERGHDFWQVHAHAVSLDERRRLPDEPRMAAHHAPTPKHYKEQTPLNPSVKQSDTSMMSLNLFDVPDVDYQYEASRDVVSQPALTGTRPITFSIPATDDYYDVNELRFQVKVRLTDPAAGYLGLQANLANSDANNTRNTYCVNNFAHSIFRDITLNMTEQSNTYHYRSYLETLLKYSREEGATKLAA